MFFFSQARQVDYKICLEVDFTSKNSQKKTQERGIGGKLALLDAETLCQAFVSIKRGVGAWRDRQPNETAEQTKTQLQLQV